jgi:hypothetical protein
MHNPHPEQDRQLNRPNDGQHDYENLSPFIAAPAEGSGSQISYRHGLRGHRHRTNLALSIKLRRPIDKKAAAPCRLYAEELVSAAEQNLAVARANYDVNKSSFLDPAIAQRQLIELREKRHKVLASALRHRADLERSIWTTGYFASTRVSNGWRRACRDRHDQISSSICAGSSSSCLSCTRNDTASLPSTRR